MQKRRFLQSYQLRHVNNLVCTDNLFVFENLTFFIDRMQSKVSMRDANKTCNLMLHNCKQNIYLLYKCKCNCLLDIAVRKIKKQKSI